MCEKSDVIFETKDNLKIERQRNTNDIINAGRTGDVICND